MSADSTLPAGDRAVAGGSGGAQAAEWWRFVGAASGRSAFAVPIRPRLGRLRGHLGACVLPVRINVALARSAHRACTSVGRPGRPRDLSTGCSTSRRTVNGYPKPPRVGEIRATATLGRPAPLVGETPNSRRDTVRDSSTNPQSVSPTSRLLREGGAPPPRAQMRAHPCVRPQPRPEVPRPGCAPEPGANFGPEVLVGETPNSRRDTGRDSSTNPQSVSPTSCLLREGGAPPPRAQMRAHPCVRPQPRPEVPRPGCAPEPGANFGPEVLGAGHLRRRRLAPPKRTLPGWVCAWPAVAGPGGWRVRQHAPPLTSPERPTEAHSQCADRGSEDVSREMPRIFGGSGTGFWLHPLRFQLIGPHVPAAALRS